MKGNFYITCEYLKSKDPCMAGMIAFKSVYPEGGKYQDILDRCCAEGHADWAGWMVRNFGNTEDTRVYNDPINDPDLSIVFAGRIVFKHGATIKKLIAGRGVESGGDINVVDGIETEFGIKVCGSIVAGEYIRVGDYIDVGRSIEPGWDVSAGGNIEAGWDIKAGNGITSGGNIEAGWSIKAGWDIKAGKGIMAGCGVKAGWSINAGDGIAAGNGIVAGEYITSGEYIIAGDGIVAGKGVIAGRGIKAGDSIEAGEDIIAYEDINVGDGYCIFAGLHVKINEWDKLARVTAKNKPANLISGFWAGSL